MRSISILYKNYLNLYKNKLTNKMNIKFDTFYKPLRVFFVINIKILLFIMISFVYSRLENYSIFILSLELVLN